MEVSLEIDGDTERFPPMVRVVEKKEATVCWTCISDQGRSELMKNLEMVHTVGRGTLKKRNEIRLKRDVKGVDFGVTDWFQLPQNRIQRLSAH